MEFFLLGFAIGVLIAAIKAAWFTRDIEGDDTLYNTPETYGKNGPYTVPKKVKQTDN